MIRLATFIALVGGYVAVVLLAGMPLFARKSDFAFVGGAWCACYWNGPETRASLPSTSFRPEAILIGAAVMGLALAFRFGMALK